MTAPRQARNGRGWCRCSEASNLETLHQVRAREQQNTERSKADARTLESQMVDMAALIEAETMAKLNAEFVAADLEVSLSHSLSLSLSLYLSLSHTHTLTHSLSLTHTQRGVRGCRPRGAAPQHLSSLDADQASRSAAPHPHLQKTCLVSMCSGPGLPEAFLEVRFLKCVWRRRPQVTD